MLWWLTLLGLGGSDSDSALPSLILRGRVSSEEGLEGRVESEVDLEGVVE